MARPIVVGAATDSYPRSYMSSHGRCEGFSVDLLDAVARVMDLRIERVTASSAELERRFANGEFDVLQAFSPGQGRDLYAEFSAPTLVLNGCIFVRKDGRISSLDDLNRSAMVLVGHNSIADRLLSDHKIRPYRLEHRSSVDEAMQLVEAGEFDATFSSRLSGLSVIERDHLTHVVPLSVALDGYEVKPSFAVHKNNTALLAKLNEGLAILYHTGEYARIHDRWFGRYERPSVPLQNVLLYVGPVLIVLLGLAMIGLWRQRRLGDRLAEQARQLAESQSDLAEAQRIARVGHWRFDALKRELVCSAETYRILERNPTKGPLTYLRVLSYVCREERGVAHRAARELLRHGTSCDLTLTALINQQKKFIHLRAQAITNRDGTVVGLVGTLQDNTQQKLYEGDLRAREQLLRAIYDNVPSGLGVVEASEHSFRFISANPGTAKLLGLDSVNTTLAGRSLDALGLPQPAVNFWTQCFQTGIEQGTLSKFEPTTDSGRRHLSITLVPLGASASGNQQLCFLVEDITERKRIDAEMAQGRRLRAVGELVGGIAHEFNNLLTPILLKAELLSTEWRDEPRLLDELRTISRAAQRGADLTRRLLAFGRRTEPKPEEVHVSAMVNAVHDLVRPTIDRRIHLQCEAAESLPPLFLNPTDLHQIVLNLVLNARDTLVEKLEIRPPDSWRATIKIAAAQFGPSAIENSHWAPSDSPVGWVCLTVQDNGMGMAQEVLERIFEPFYTTKQVGKGTGLGLATVWHLVTRIGGKVTVQSRVNEGTIFQIWLPILPVKPASGPVVGKTSEEARTNARICLVEDDDLVAHTIASALRRQHHHVVHFRNGAEAWRHLSTQYASYDLLLLDLDLPGINGIEIARRARASRYAGKILVASGRLTETEARELDKIGVDLQIEKPFSPQKLHLAVQTCMAATGKPPARFEPVK